MPAILGWRAQTIDGLWLDKEEALAKGWGNLREFEVFMEGGGLIRLTCDPSKGEQAMIFTRNIITVPGGKVSMPVFQIMPDPGDQQRFVRLYLHPTNGPILSTEDIYG